MELSDAIRYYIEENGIERVPDIKFYWWLSDLANSESWRYRYIISSAGFQNLFEKLIDTTGDENCVSNLSYKYSTETGFQQNIVNDLLTLLSLGIRKAFFGKYPNSSDIPLKELYNENIESWRYQEKAFSKEVYLTKKDGLYAWINSEGKDLLKRIYKKAKVFSDGYSYVETGDIRGFINIRGNLEIDIKKLLPNKAINGNWYQAYVSQFINGIAKYWYRNGKFGLINIKEKFTEPIYETCDIDVKLDYFRIKRDGLWGFMNKDLELMVQPSFILADQLSDKCFIVKDKNNQYSILKKIPQNDKLELIPLKTSALPYNYNKKGEIIIIYYQLFNQILKSFYNLNGHDLSFAKQITVDNIEKYPIIYKEKQNFCFMFNDGWKNHEPELYAQVYQFSYGYAWVKKGYNWILINENGEEKKRTDKVEILSEYFWNGTLARNRRTGNICVLMEDNTINSEIKDSSDIDPVKEKYYYCFTVKNKFYIFEKGKIFLLDLPVISKYDIRRVINTSYENIEDRLGDSFNIVATSNSEIALIWDYAHGDKPHFFEIGKKERIISILSKSDRIVVMYGDWVNRDQGKGFYLYSLDFCSSSCPIKSPKLINTNYLTAIKIKDGLKYFMNYSFRSLTEGYKDIKKLKNWKFIVSKDIMNNGNITTYYGLLNDELYEELPLVYESMEFQEKLK